MSDLKRRKVPQEDSDVKRKSKPSQNTTVKRNKLQFYFLTALVFSTCLLGFYLNLFQWNSFSHNVNILDNLSLTLGLKSYVYSVVIDAGSTGSRILFYGFVSSSKEKSLKLHQEFFRELTPGISAFANNPQESVKNLKVLLDEAKSRIPKEEWPKTSLLMKATAGLRLLPGHKADALLAEAKKFFKNSGFKINDDSISVIDGSDEGLFSWFTVNFLLDRLGSELLNTVVALDLGGGSAQVSFVPSRNDTIPSSQSQYLTKIAAFHKELEVYSRSYLGLGLNEARRRIIQYNSNHSSVYRSDCINPIVKTKWTYGGVEYNIQGPEKAHYAHSEERGEVFETPIVEFSDCEAVVKDVVLKFGKPPSLAGKEIFAFSYFYDRAADSGLIDLKKGGVVTLHSFVEMAKSKCRDANVDQPFMCLDLVFISVLLRDSFGIPESSKINIQFFWGLNGVGEEYSKAYKYIQYIKDGNCSFLEDFIDVFK